MGFKTIRNNISNNTIQSNICNPFKKGGLIFDSEADYLLFKSIDLNMSTIDRLLTLI